MFLCIFFTLISLPRLKNLIRHQKHLQKYKTEITQLEKENEILLEHIEVLKNDPYYTEKLLRENYGYIKDDEFIYRIKK